MASTTRTTKHVAASVLAVALLFVTAAGCGTFLEKKSADQGGGPQGVGNATSNNLGGGAGP